jgi:hypothetical protein
MKIIWITDLKSEDSLLIENRYRIFSDGCVYDTKENKDIPLRIFKLRDQIIKNAKDVPYF